MLGEKVRGTFPTSIGMILATAVEAKTAAPMVNALNSMMRDVCLIVKGCMVVEGVGLLKVSVERRDGFEEENRCQEKLEISKLLLYSFL